MLRLKRPWTIFDLPQKIKKIAKLEEIVNHENFWDDPNKAKAIIKQLEFIRGQIAFWNNLNDETINLNELYQLSTNEKDSRLLEEINNKYKELYNLFAHKEIEVLLAGKYDVNNAILTIHAGTGGTDAQDWAEMLMRMYLRYIERMNWKAKIIDKISGSEAGIKSTTIKVRGNYAYGYLNTESGTHRLVRLSPFDADHSRHTSFALVEVLPEIEDEKEIIINPKDIKIDTFKSSGAGGQHVNVTDSAVRITHIPTNITVSCQNERSQLQNKESALKVLKSKLLELEIKKTEQEREKEKGDYKEAKWGNQIRSYVLHPYQMVNDHRTNYKVKNAQNVLDGKINDFIDIYLKTKLKNSQ